MSRYQHLMDALERAVFGARGHLSQATRRAASNNGSLPPILARIVEMIHKHAYRITDEDIRSLHDAGYSDDQIFESVVSASVGASKTRLDHAMKLLQETDS